MLASIHLHHQHQLGAAEISEVVADRVLPAKVSALDLTSAQMLPQTPLGISWR
jgi:hypothetical protein